ncbi:Calcium-dependent protein kinase 1 [Symbiodinium microadriaticum]|uniref:Calcium-dependent protein kinase 1 n=1 Tax=Symbiodinium microadriaticum TaxID=2951 RepID=A0A1Q9EBX5_SYMMI|nr:Calcium-dependent protein kinase 1 [Symbiodinium microadriaticum]
MTRSCSWHVLVVSLIDLAFEAREANDVFVNKIGLFGPSHGKGMRSSARSGTLTTIAPEVLQGDFCYKCDVWSLGCMLFAVFNPQPSYIPGPDGNPILCPYPFHPQPTERDRLGLDVLMQQQRKGPDLRRLTAGHALKDLVGRMLCFEEEQRPSAKECLRSSWLGSGGNTPLENQAQSKQESLKIIISPVIDHDREHRTWWRAVAVQAAAQLPGGVLESLAKLFREAHEGQTDGAIEKHALVQMLQRLKVSPELAQSAADMADFDGDGLIEFSEFVATCLPSARELFAVSLQMAFHSFDTNSDGTLDRTEIAQLLQSGQIEENHLPKTKTVQEMVEELDLDHNGVISFSEFQHYFMNAACICSDLFLPSRLISSGDVPSLMPDMLDAQQQQQQQQQQQDCGFGLGVLLGNVRAPCAHAKGKLKVQYRNSRLTMLLRDSLGGDSKFVNVSPLQVPVQFAVAVLNLIAFVQCSEVKAREWFDASSFRSLIVMLV